MAQFDRTKKLTSYVYSPTDPASEDAIRLQVDNSIQEIADMLYSQDAGKGASQVGINGLAYATVQDLAQVVSDSGTGTAPPADSVGNAQLATDVKVGSLASSTTTDKSSVIAVTNEIDAKVNSINLPVIYKLSSEFTTTGVNYNTVPDITIPVESGKSYEILIVGKWKRSTSANATDLNLFLASGAGTLNGSGIDFTAVNTVSNYQLTTIGAVGTAGAGIGMGGSLTTYKIFNMYFVFTCTSTGVLQMGLKIETSGTAAISAGTSATVKKY